MKSGIYQILNTVTNKCYIGSSKNISKRKYQHYKSLRSNSHYNRYLQRAFNKYGEDSFQFHVLSKTPYEYLIPLEQWFIDSINPEYNLSPTAGRTTGYKHTKEFKVKKSKEREIPVVRIDLNTKEYIASYKSAKHAAKVLNFGSSTSITACCRKKIPSAFGSYWMKEDEYLNIGVNVIHTSKNQPKPKEEIDKAIKLFKEGKSITDIVNLTNLSYNNVYYHVNKIK